MRQTEIYIAITTYDRVESLQLLLDDISRETKGKNVDLIRYDITRYSRNHGKPGYWSIMNDVFRDAETWNFKYFFFLQDDCRLAEGFFEKAIQEYEEIGDPNKATLCTFTPQSVYER